MNIAWAHWSSSTVPPGGSPPSGSDKGDLANWEFETNLLEPAGLAITSSGAGYKLTGDSTMRDLVTGTAGWIFRKGIQASTNGLYYGREFPNCEPIADGIPNCSYNSVSAGSVEASRFLNGEVLGGLSVAYALNPDSASKLKIDKLFGATLGKLGGPESDGISASLLQSSLNGCCPKNFGFFHGFGRAYVWHAARLGGLSP
jgi:hypothetical protein